MNLKPALALTAALCVWASAAKRQASARTVTVWTALTDVAPLTPLDGAMLRLETMPARFAAPDALPGAVDPTGMMSRVELPPGTQLTASALSPRKARLSQRIGRGYRAVEVPVTAALAAMTEPGHGAAVSVTFPGSLVGKEEVLNMLLLHNQPVPILGVVAPAKTGSAGGKPGSGEGTMILEVEPMMGQYVELSKQVGSVDVLLRSDEDESDYGPGTFMSLRRLLR